MMTVTVIPPEDCLFSASKYFDLNYMDEWFSEPLVKEMVLGVDKTEVINSNMSISPILGGISNENLSGGVKGLILILKDPDKRIFSSTIFGSNCVPWIAKLSGMVDFTLVMEHSLELNTPEPITAQTIDGKPLRTGREVWSYYVNNYPKSGD